MTLCRNFVWKILLCLSPCFAANGVIAGETEDPPAAILLNQLGFYPRAEKIAIVRGGSVNAAFVVLDTGSHDTIYRGRLRAGDKVSADVKLFSIADFSDITKSGRYQLMTLAADGVAIRSHEFSIGTGIHHALAAASIKGFYFQRSDGELADAFAGKWARPAGHPDTTVLIHSSASGPGRPAGTVISSPGGWYDAGDYNKYIVNSGITMGTLMSAYEDFKPWFDTLGLNIPESGNSQADLLDEVAYNLRWMLSMQDPNDGGVYHKCTNAAFDGNVMPGATKLPRYVVQKSTAAALDFAAVMAQAARVFARDKSRANRGNPEENLPAKCLAAAKRAWQWAMANPAILYNQDSINKIHQPAITTGAYGDRSLTDEWFWAASEMYITTGDPAFSAGLKASLSSPVTLPGWPSVRTMGVFSLLRHRQKIGSFKHAGTEAMIGQLESQLLKLADEYLVLRAGNKLLTVMGSRKSDFNWGSNSNAANQGILLINAWKINGSPKMLDAALANLDYLCGRNATGYCFITGFGTVSPMHPHHRPSVADKITEPVPGLLAGGPNSGMQDKCSYRYTEPELAYTDEFCSYASNEIAINWNAPLVYLVNAIEAISATTYSKPTSLHITKTTSLCCSQRSFY